MKITESPLAGLKIIEPTVHRDHRGYFLESYKKNAFAENGIPDEFVQDNQSKSDKGVLRGLHFQLPPHAQGKLVRVITGAVLDVCVDLRKSSNTYGKYYSHELTDENMTMLFIPEGFAHGFLTLENDTIFAYKCTNYYNKEAEGGILWNDRDIGLDWPLKNVVVNEKDMKNARLKDFDSPFA